jgi:hypothetical protein
MSDHTPDSNHYRSAADRAREDREEFPLRIQTYDMAMQMARDMRRARASIAAKRTIETAGQLAALIDPAPETRGDPMWELRGEPRNREHFADPHRGDFPGGLPLPAEFPL